MPILQLRQSLSTCTLCRNLNIYMVHSVLQLLTMRTMLRWSSWPQLCNAYAYAYVYM